MKFGMHLYEIIALGTTGVPDVPMFADSYEMAAHYYAIWWIHHREGDMPNHEIRKRNPGWSGLDTELLQKAMNHDYAGVGIFDSENGWSIYFPDCEEAGALA